MNSRAKKELYVSKVMFKLFFYCRAGIRGGRVLRLLQFLRIIRSGLPCHGCITLNVLWNRFLQPGMWNPSSCGWRLRYDLTWWIHLHLDANVASLSWKPSHSAALTLVHCICRIISLMSKLGIVGSTVAQQILLLSVSTFGAGNTCPFQPQTPIFLFLKLIDGLCFVTIYDIKWHATAWILGELVGQWFTFH